MENESILALAREAREKIQDIDCMNIGIRRANQRQVNEAYKILDVLVKKLERGDI